MKKTPKTKTANTKGARTKGAKTKRATTKAAGPKSAKARVAKTDKRPAPKRLTPAELALKVLDDLKAQSVVQLDVRHLTSMTDTMIIASGRSDRHVRSIAQALVEAAKAAGYAPLGVEGEGSGEWVLVDLGDVVTHVMLPRAREFYSLEKLWDIAPREGRGGVG
jgi:ribosome-associated protein